MMAILATEPDDDVWEEVEEGTADDIAQQVLKMATDAATYDKDGTEMVQMGVVGNIVEKTIVELLKMLRDL